MTRKKFFLIVLLVSNSLFVNSQKNDILVNNTEKSIKVWRTTNNTKEVIAFPVNPFTVPQNTEKYIYMLVNYPAQPDIAIAIDATNKNDDGNFDNIIRPINAYTNIGKWETLVFPISGGNEGLSVNTILIYTDLGQKNNPVGKVLNNSDRFGYLDEIVLKDTNTLTNLDLKVDNLFIYPNPSTKTFTISTSKNIHHITLYNNLGKEFTSFMYKLDSKTYDISALAKGLYFIKIVTKNGSVEIKKLVKK